MCSEPAGGCGPRMAGGRRRRASRVALPAALLAMFVLGAAAGWAQRITNVGIVDLQRVTTTYFRESTALRQLQAEQQEVQAERARLEAEIFELEARKVEAEQADRRSEALRLDSQIFDLKQHLRNYLTVKNRQISQLAARVSESDAFLGELTAAIEFVAESEGLSIVLNKNSDAFLFFVPEVDVTDLVIAELERRASARL